MRYPASSRLSYRNVLVAAGLAASLGVSAAYSEPSNAIAAQPQRNKQLPEEPVAAPVGSDDQASHSQSR